MKTYLTVAHSHPAGQARQQTILVVEDNDDQWFITRWALLRTLPEVTIVRTGSTLDTLGYLTACAYEQRPLPALILLDLYLPDREEGWAVLESIKQHPSFRRIPVIMLSSSASNADIEQSYFQRSSSYMVKPTSYPEWLVLFNYFRRYWLESVTLPQTGSSRLPAGQ